ncbi:MAG: hypothetical protein ACYTAS_12470 [Planctomycetota bacterium]|jgi:hypothetical protein
MKNAFSHDTSPAALSEQIRVLRALGVEGRARMTFELSDNLRRVVADGVRYRHPDWDTEQVRRGVARIMLGERLFAQVFGDSNAADE